MDVTARLIPTHVPTKPDGVVLVLHGGGSRVQGMRVSPTQLSVLRMIPIARQVVRRGDGRLAVFRLLNSVRGWDAHHTPVDDVRWALRQVAERFGSDLPACLVGHSLGGRAAILSADQETVRSVVALAPWLYPDDGWVRATGRHILIVQGTADRISSPVRSKAAAVALRRSAVVGYIEVEGGSHSMLKHHRVFDSAAADFAAATLLHQSPPAADGAVAQALTGADVRV